MKKAIVISSYPSEKAIHGQGTVGVASYAKNTLGAIQKTSKGALFTVLAEKLLDETDYRKNNISVKRIWKRNSFLTFFQILKGILKEKDSKTVVIEFELAMFGALPYLLPFPLFLVLLKLLHKKIILINHQVIPNIDEVGPHINVRTQSSLTSGFFNVGLSIFYRLMMTIADKVIVFEEVLKSRLSLFGNKRKISVIPHGVETFSKIPTKKEARKKLRVPSSSYVVLVFGFLAWYKGSDWIIPAVQKLKEDKKLKGKNIQLILAGGANPNHLDKDFYMKYISAIENACLEHDIILSGFVPENEIASYYQACDMVVFPYRTFMSSSGPLSITFSFKKPFLLSPKLKGILIAPDMVSSMKRLKIKQEDIYFTDFNGDFAKKLQRIRINSRLQKKLSRLASTIKQQRSWNVIGSRYYDEIFA